jgi:predicted nucleic acid-binding protein
MGDFTALYDSCVLYPAPLRDLLMHLAVTDLFRARWSDAIHDEWINSVLGDRPDLTRDKLERTRELMNAHVRDALVTGYESLVPSLTLPDPDDRHVLAAAIRSGADVIVTFNLKHFPEEALTPFGIEAQHPDDFLCFQLDLAPHIVCAAAKRQRESLKNPPKTVEEYLASLERQGLAQTVSMLRPFAALL